MSKTKNEKEEKKKAEVKIKELPAKIKEIKEGEKEESELEEELEEAESSNFGEFMTSRRGGITHTLVPEEAVVERGEARYASSRQSAAPSETPSHMRYEQTSYTSAQKAARITAPILRAGSVSAPSQREAAVQDLERFRDERLRAREEKSETYHIEAAETKARRKMPWE